MDLKEKILGNSAAKIQEQSNSVLDVFTKTIKDLETLNTTADAELVKREEIIKKAQDEQTILNATKTKNLTVISKINKIFEE